MKRATIMLCCLAAPGAGEPLFPIVLGYDTGASPDAVASADLNGDGFPDLAVANFGSDDLTIGLNLGDGVFSIATLPVALDRPESVSLADLNGDGLIDAVAAGFGSDDVAVLLGNGDGTFQPQLLFNAGDEPRWTEVAEVNGDGDPDIAVVNGNDGTVSILIGNGDGTFSELNPPTPVGAGPVHAALPDLNGDGVPDLVVSNFLGNDVTVRLGVGDGTFGADLGFAVGNSPRYVGAGRLDGDDFVDVVVANRFSDNVTLRRGNGDGTFQPEELIGVGSQPQSLVIQDLDGDGRDDLAVAIRDTDRVDLLFQRADGTFEPRLPAFAGDQPGWVSGLDADLDGDRDLVVTNAAGRVSVLLNRGDGTLHVEPRFPVGIDPVSVAIGDLNNDGFADLVTTNFSSDDVSVLLGAGNASFHPPLPFPTGSGARLQPRSTVLADFDGINGLDIANVNDFTDQLVVLLNNGDATAFSGSTFGAGRQPLSTAAGHFDGDPHLDLAVVNNTDDDVTLFLNDGNGGFARRTPDIPVGAGPNVSAAGDVNGDGRDDIVVCNGTDDTVSVLLNTGGGNFAVQPPSPVGDKPSGVVIADLKGDFDLALDLAITCEDSDDVTVLLNYGNGTFQAQTYPVGTDPRSIAAADFDADGVLDLAVANSATFGPGGDDVSVLLGLGGGLFAPEFRVAAGDRPTGIAAGDIDGDGFPDLATSNATSDDVSVLLNTTFRPAYWIGAGSAFGLGSNWLDGVAPSLEAPTGAAFDDSVFPFGPIDSVLVTENAELQAFVHASAEVRLNLGGRDLELTGDPSSPLGTIGLALGVEQLGGPPLPTEAPVLRIRNQQTNDDARLATQDLQVGATGPAVLRIEAGNSVAELSVSNSVVIGAAAPGTLELDGDTGRLTYSPGALVTIGNRARAEVAITSGAFVGSESASDTSPLSFARLPLGEALVEIDGVGSTWDHRGSRVSIGERGHANIVVSNGAALLTDVADIVLAEHARAIAEVVIGGGGSIWRGVNATMEIGLMGQASVEVREGGTLDVFLVFVNADGTLGGDGSILADVVNFGTLRVGAETPAEQADPSQLTIAGTLDQFDDENDPKFSGRVLLDVFDTAGTLAADTLVVQGEARLAGSVIVEAAEPLGPALPGQTIELISTGNADDDSRFDVALLPGLPDGKFFRLAYGLEQTGAGSVSLVVDSLGLGLGFDGPTPTTVSGIPEAAELIDMNNDGLLDLVLIWPNGPAAGTLLVLINAGVSVGGWDGFVFDAAFQTNTGVEPSDLAVGDLDGDTFPDIAVTNRADRNVSIFINDGAGVPVASGPVAFNQAPEALVIGDLDMDGRNDVAVAGSDAGGSGLLNVALNSGGTGAGWQGLSVLPDDFVIGDRPVFMDIGDFDNDSCLDLFLGSLGDEGVNLLDNLGSDEGSWLGFATPLTFATGPGPVAGDIGDCDNDTCFDLVVADETTGELAIIRHKGGQGIFTFTPPAFIPIGPAPRSVVVADLDGDGDDDAAFVTDSDDGLSHVVRLLRNDLQPGDDQLQFAPATTVPTNGEPSLILAGDVDLDTATDLVAVTDATTETGRATPAGGVSTMLNASGPLPCNPADLAAPFGVVDLDDVDAFIAAFLAGDPAADLVDPAGVLDLDDVDAYIAAFLTGCP